MAELGASKALLGTPSSFRVPLNPCVEMAKLGSLKGVTSYALALVAKLGSFKGVTSYALAPKGSPQEAQRVSDGCGFWGPKGLPETMSGLSQGLSPHEGCTSGGVI